MKKRTPGLPAPLSRARQLFDQWRKKNRPRAHLPEPFWNKAVGLARIHGHNRTAKALKLDYYSLKKRLEAKSMAPRKARKLKPAFVEVFPSAQAECIIELEDGGESKMRITLKGSEVPDLEALSGSFWNNA